MIVTREWVIKMLRNIITWIVYTKRVHPEIRKGKTFLQVGSSHFRFSLLTVLFLWRSCRSKLRFCCSSTVYNPPVQLGRRTFHGHVRERSEEIIRRYTMENFPRADTSRRKPLTLVCQLSSSRTNQWNGMRWMRNEGENDVLKLNFKILGCKSRNSKWKTGSQSRSPGI